jgi:hypothetical protein
MRRLSLMLLLLLAAGCDKLLPLGTADRSSRDTSGDSNRVDAARSDARSDAARSDAARPDLLRDLPPPPDHHQPGSEGCGALTLCSGVCVDTTSDPAHCSKCGVQCSPGLRCKAAACVCDGQSCNGCCQTPVGPCASQPVNAACGSGGAKCQVCGECTSCMFGTCSAVSGTSCTAGQCLSGTCCAGCLRLSVTTKQWECVPLGLQDSGSCGKQGAVCITCLDGACQPDGTCGCGGC